MTCVQRDSSVARTTEQNDTNAAETREARGGERERNRTTRSAEKQAKDSSLHRRQASISGVHASCALTHEGRAQVKCDEGGVPPSLEIHDPVPLARHGPYHDSHGYCAEQAVEVQQTERHGGRDERSTDNNSSARKI